MKKILFIFLILAFLSACDEDEKKITSDNDIKKKELELKEKELELKEKELQQQKELNETKKTEETTTTTTDANTSAGNEITPPPTTTTKPNVTTKPPKTTTGGKYGDYPYCSTRYLNNSDIAGRSAYELRIMRNEIYARHGYIFQSSELKTHFGSKPWYTPLYANVTGMLSKVEKYNAEFLLNAEKRIH